jgi:hypothetical protein
LFRSESQKTKGKIVIVVDFIPLFSQESYWVMVNAMMGADSQMYEYLLGGGLAQILVQLLEENLDQALFDRAIVSFDHHF